jgi:hypothetical protein
MDHSSGLRCEVCGFAMGYSVDFSVKPVKSVVWIFMIFYHGGHGTARINSVSLRCKVYGFRFGNVLLRGFFRENPCAQWLIFLFPDKASPLYVINRTYFYYDFRATPLISPGSVLRGHGTAWIIRTVYGGRFVVLQWVTLWISP